MEVVSPPTNRTSRTPEWNIGGQTVQNMLKGPEAGRGYGLEVPGTAFGGLNARTIAISGGDGRHPLPRCHDSPCRPLRFVGPIGLGQILLALRYRVAL